MRKANHKRHEYLLATYGISNDQYEDMLKAQGGRCAICNQEGKLVVDHSHDHGPVRGLLCNRCNLGLGSFLDSIHLLNRAKNYLKASGVCRDRAHNKGRVVEKSVDEIMQDVSKCPTCKRQIEPNESELRYVG